MKDLIDIKSYHWEIKTEIKWKDSVKYVIESFKDLFSKGYCKQLVAYIVLFCVYIINYYGAVYNTGQLGLASIQQDTVLSCGWEIIV